MSDALELAAFADRIGQGFRVELPEADPVELELIEASRVGELSARQARELGKREPFSLLFRGPAEAVLSQATWKLAHPELGELEIFLVPIDRRAEGMIYEAVFT